MATAPHDTKAPARGAELLDARLALGDECARQLQGSSELEGPADPSADSAPDEGPRRLSVAARVAAPFAVAIVVMALIVLAVMNG